MILYYFYILELNQNPPNESQDYVLCFQCLENSEVNLKNLLVLVLKIGTAFKK